MKIELEISNTQLEALDKDLTTFLSTLDDDQKLTLLGKYLENQFQDIYTSGYWGGRELTDFGKNIVNGLKDKISNAYIENYYLNNEELKNQLDNYVEDIKKDLPNIIKTAISDYIATNLCHSTSDISMLIQTGINMYMAENNNRDRSY